jgi:hypothetical protein
VRRERGCFCVDMIKVNLVTRLRHSALSLCVCCRVSTSLRGLLDTNETRKDEDETYGRRGRRSLLRAEECGVGVSNSLCGVFSTVRASEKEGERQQGRRGRTRATFASTDNAAQPETR